MGIHDKPDPARELSVRPGTQAGWTLPLQGAQRCVGFGHELGPLIEYGNGLLVGYCVRCETRVEIPWFQGGTICALAKTMAEEALQIEAPAVTVLEDLDQILGLLDDDIDQLTTTARLVRATRALVARRME